MHGVEGRGQLANSEKQEPDPDSHFPQSSLFLSHVSERAVRAQGRINLLKIMEQDLVQISSSLVFLLKVINAPGRIQSLLFICCVPLGK